MADEAADSHALLSDGAGDKDAEAWTAPDAAPPTKVSDETKTSGTKPSRMVAAWVTLPIIKLGASR